MTARSNELSDLFISVSISPATETHSKAACRMGPFGRRVQGPLPRGTDPVHIPSDGSSLPPCWFHLGLAGTRPSRIISCRDQTSDTHRLSLVDRSTFDPEIEEKIASDRAFTPHKAAYAKRSYYTCGWLLSQRNRRDLSSRVRGCEPLKANSQVTRQQQIEMKATNPS